MYNVQSVTSWERADGNIDQLITVHSWILKPRVREKRDFPRAAPRVFSLSVGESRNNARRSSDHSDDDCTARQVSDNWTKKLPAKIVPSLPP